MSTTTIWPPAAMTAATTSLANGSYIATASTTYTAGNEPYRAFDKTLGTGSANYWASGNSTYTTNGVPSAGAPTTVAGGTTYTGEWLQLQLPLPMILRSYWLQCRNDNTVQQPVTWYILGSNDGTIWSLVDTQTNISWTTNGQTKEFVTNYTSTTSYKYYRMVISLINTTGAQVVTSISEWYLNGPGTFSISTIQPYVVQKSFFKYNITGGSASTAVASAGTIFPLNNTIAAVNMLTSSGYGLQANGSVKIPYSGLWLLHHRICSTISGTTYQYNQRHGWNSSTGDTASRYGMTNSYDNVYSFQSPLHNHGAGGETTNIFITYANAGDTVNIQTQQNGGTYDYNRIFLSGVYLGP